MFVEDTTTLLSDLKTIAIKYPSNYDGIRSLMMGDDSKEDSIRYDVTIQQDLEDLKDDCFWSEFFLKNRGSIRNVYFLQAGYLPRKDSLHFFGKLFASLPLVESFFALGLNEDDVDFSQAPRLKNLGLYQLISGVVYNWCPYLKHITLMTVSGDVMQNLPAGLRTLNVVRHDWSVTDTGSLWGLNISPAKDSLVQLNGLIVRPCHHPDEELPDRSFPHLEELDLFVLFTDEDMKNIRTFMAQMKNFANSLKNFLSRTNLKRLSLTFKFQLEQSDFCVGAKARAPKVFNWSEVLKILSPVLQTLQYLEIPFDTRLLEPSLYPLSLSKLKFGPTSSSRNKQQTIQSFGVFKFLEEMFQKLKGLREVIVEERMVLNPKTSFDIIKNKFLSGNRFKLTSGYNDEVITEDHPDIYNYKKFATDILRVEKNQSKQRNF